MKSSPGGFRGGARDEFGSVKKPFAVDISSVIAQKFTALRAHTSQLAEHFDELEAQVRIWTAETGKKHGMEHAEEFHRAENR